MKKIVFITGATAGFGEACAHTFAAAGYSVILNGRRQERLSEIGKTLQTQYGIQTLQLPFDVQDRVTVTTAIASLPEEWKAIDVLINNAGLALGRDLFQDADLEDWEIMLDTNVKGLLYVSKAIVLFMISRGKGQIINIGSIAGKQVYERGNVYCASKHAVDALTKGMRIDLLPHGIKVTAVHPGAADTEFSLVRFKGNSEAAVKVYEGFEPLHAQDVADVVYYTTTLPPHVCINDLVVTCTRQADAHYLNKN
jgi:NADP-dependent 3-hydroxy acid dehydrogenase YdfG